MTTNSAKLVSTAVLLCGLVVGCAPNWEPPPTMMHFPDDMSDAQKAAIADSKVTDEEYTTGFRAYQTCMEEAGYEIFGIERPSTVINFNIPEAGVTSGADEKCYNRNFAAIDWYWQTTHPPVTKYDVYARECLAAEGLPTDGNIEELKQRMWENGIDINHCFKLDIPEPEY